MLEQVFVRPRSLDAYRGEAPDATLDALQDVARHLRGARVLHVNATPYGGGVSELLRSTVPLLNGLGLVADWKVVRGDDRFFRVTKKIHNGLQGAALELTEAERSAYLSASQHNARLLEEEYDFVFLHDPQPAGIRGFRPMSRHARWIWRCHIDTSAPAPGPWAFLRARLAGFDAAVFTMREFVPPDLPIDFVSIIPPAIDPLSPKNIALDRDLAERILTWIGVRTDVPLATQISRFDPWKDPPGVIEAVRLARAEVPDLELALVGSMALDDPEAWDIYRSIENVAREEPWLHVFTNLVGVGNIEVNAFQRLSSVVVQKSLREGFGLVVSEALWKGTPVVAGRAGGIPLQMADGIGGTLVDDVDECARAIVDLLRDPAQARAAGRQGRERVRRHFLTPRLVLDELELVQKLAAGHPIARPPSWWSDRDPVCGMAVPGDGAAPAAAVEGVQYRFCSVACQLRFLTEPQRYVTARGQHMGGEARDG